MMKYLFIPLVAAVFLFAACSDDSSDSAVTLPSGGTLTGSWAKACFNDGGDGAIPTLTLGSSSGSYTFDSYWGDVDCEAETSSLTDSGTFSYVLGDTIELDSGETVTQMTITDTAETVTTHTDEATDGLNSQTAFGFDDWETGVAKDVFGIDYDGSETTAEAEKDIVYIDTDATPNTLEFGDASGGTDSDDYPTALDGDPWERQ